MFFLSFLVYVVAEIVAFVAVAGQIGFLGALALLILVSVLGPFVVKRAGFSVLASTRDRLARGEAPTRELLDGLVVLIGGVLVCVPGFVTDAIGLLLMIGPVRHVAIRLAGHRLAKRVGTIRTGRWLFIDASSRPARRGYEFHPGAPELPRGPKDGLGL